MNSVLRDGVSLALENRGFELAKAAARGKRRPARIDSS